MQLPRGTFREIRKSVAIESLLKELEGEKFSGAANVSSPALTGTLVFKAGKCILVKFQGHRGDAGWDELQKAAAEEVDAALSVLGDAQIDLALEFNKPFRLLKIPRQAPAPAAAARPAPEPPRETYHKPAAPVAPLKSAVKPAPVRHHGPAPQATHAPPMPPSLFAKAATPAPQPPQMPPAPRREEKKPGEPEPAAAESEVSSFETDLDTFDTMDIDNVTDKIRTDCKTMIKQLHLDHLMER
jgi:hypothetical protein